MTHTTMTTLRQHPDGAARQQGGHVYELSLFKKTYVCHCHVQWMEHKLNPLHTRALLWTKDGTSPVMCVMEIARVS